jgi:hypothetical protein
MYENLPHSVSWHQTTEETKTRKWKQMAMKIEENLGRLKEQLISEMLFVTFKLLRAANKLIASVVRSLPTRRFFFCLNVYGLPNIIAVGKILYCGENGRERVIQFTFFLKLCRLFKDIWYVHIIVWK